jgi:hypothetical protein
MTTLDQYVLVTCRRVNGYIVMIVVTPDQVSRALDLHSELSREEQWSSQSNVWSWSSSQVSFQVLTCLSVLNGWEAANHTGLCRSVNLDFHVPTFMGKVEIMSQGM